MRQLPYQNTQVIGEYGQTPSTASDLAGAYGAYSDYQSGQTADPAADPAAAAGDVAPTPDAAAAAGDVQPDNVPPPGDDPTNVSDFVEDPSSPWAGGGYIGAHGGYLSSSGILAPYHKKLIDGLYAGGRINY